MNSRIRLISILILIVLASPVILLKGCGNETSAPNGSTITVSPVSVSWKSGYTLTGCGSLSQLKNLEPFKIVVLDKDKNPLNGVTITVTLGLSPGSSGPPVTILKLYDGETGDLLTSPASLKTGDFGTKFVYVEVDFGCTYKATLGVFSGTAYGAATVEVTSS